MTQQNKEELLKQLDSFLIWQGNEWELSIRHPDHPDSRYCYYGVTMSEAIDECMDNLPLIKCEGPGVGTIYILKKN